jgi:hypothetical protein
MSWNPTCRRLTYRLSSSRTRPFLLTLAVIEPETPEATSNHIRSLPGLPTRKLVCYLYTCKGVQALAANKGKRV